MVYTGIITTVTVLLGISYALDSRAIWMIGGRVFDPVLLIAYTAMWVILCGLPSLSWLLIQKMYL